MQGFNLVVLMGNLSRDVELRYTPKGLAVGKFGLAVNRSWKDEQGNTKEEVTFIDVDCFGKQAEILARYVKKGHALHIQGRLKLDQWEDKQTHQKRQKLGVVLESFTFVPRPGADSQGGEQQRRPAPSQRPQPQPSDNDGVLPPEDQEPQHDIGF